MPGEDICLKGFDFHNTFNVISEKLRNAERHPYALMAFDLYSLCDLILSRLAAAEISTNQQNAGTFFSGKKNLDTQIGVLNETIGFISVYLAGRPSDEKSEYQNMLLSCKKVFEKAIVERTSSPKV